MTESLRALAREERVTLFTTLFAVFTVLLQRHSGQDDVVVGTPVAGRSRQECGDLIGAFMNTLVLRVQLSGNPTFRTFLDRVHEVTSGALIHQDMPFMSLTQNLWPERRSNETPFLQVVFNMQILPPSEIDLPGLTARTLAPPDDNRAQCDLTIYASEHPEAIELQWVYRAARFEPRRMAEMFRQYEQLLDQVVENPDRRLSDLSLH